MRGFNDLKGYCSLIFKNLVSLKNSLQVSWDSLEPEMLRASSENTKKRLEAVVEARGGYIEDK